MKRRGRTRLIALCFALNRLVHGLRNRCSPVGKGDSAAIACLEMKHPRKERSIKTLFSEHWPCTKHARFVAPREDYRSEACANGLLDAAMPPLSSRWAGVIGIDDALCGTPGSRHLALWQRGIGALEVIVGKALVHLQADRITW